MNTIRVVGYAIVLAVAGSMLSATAAGPSLPPTTVGIEYRHPSGEYFLATSALEQALLDDSAPWTRTGYTFSVWPVTARDDRLQPVCRFVGPTGRVWTADPAQCVRGAQDAPSSFEGVAFKVAARDAFGCPAGTRAIYRVRSHVYERLVADEALLDELLAQGWQYEGIAFCTVAAD